MTCYRSGGCGPYEGRSCTECPASHPEYANRDVGHTDLQKLAQLVVQEQKALTEKAAKHKDAISIYDADTTLADMLEKSGDSDWNGTGSTLCQLVTSMTPEQLEMFQDFLEIAVGLSLQEYLNTALQTVQHTANTLKSQTDPDMEPVSFTVQCMATYDATMLVPKGLSREEQQAYVEQHKDDIPLGELSYVPDSEGICFPDPPDEDD